MALPASYPQKSHLCALDHWVYPPSFNFLHHSSAVWFSLDTFAANLCWQRADYRTISHQDDRLAFLIPPECDRISTYYFVFFDQQMMSGRSCYNGISLRESAFFSWCLSACINQTQSTTAALRRPIQAHPWTFSLLVGVMGWRRGHWTDARTLFSLRLSPVPQWVSWVSAGSWRLLNFNNQACVLRETLWAWWSMSETP